MCPGIDSSDSNDSNATCNSINTRMEYVNCMSYLRKIFGWYEIGDPHEDLKWMTCVKYVTSIKYVVTVKHKPRVKRMTCMNYVSCVNSTK